MVSPHAAVVLLAAAAASALAAAAASSSADGPEFGYTPGSKDGPENWGKLSPEYRLCSEGKRQSPINIVTKDAVPSPNLPDLHRTYAAAAATLINDGVDITMAFDGEIGNVSIKEPVFSAEAEKMVEVDKWYSLKKIHWHSPSEHTINGKRFPLELHLVHKSDDGKIAVIAILYEIGAPDSFYYQLKEKLEELGKERCRFGEEEARVAAGVVQLRSLQKRTGSYFRYQGSLTTPPCTEKVAWNVLGKVRQISKQQLDLLTAPLPARDSRPPQPLNGRAVGFYNPPNSTVSFQMY